MESYEDRQLEALVADAVKGPIEERERICALLIERMRAIDLAKREAAAEQSAWIAWLEMRAARELSPQELERLLAATESYREAKAERERRLRRQVDESLAGVAQAADGRWRAPAGLTGREAECHAHRRRCEKRLRRVLRRRLGHGRCVAPRAARREARPRRRRSSASSRTSSTDPGGSEPPPPSPRAGRHRCHRDLLGGSQAQGGAS